MSPTSKQGTRQRITISSSAFNQTNTSFLRNAYDQYKGEMDTKSGNLSTLTFRPTLDEANDVDDESDKY